jgi:hypothetical protein
MRKIGHGGGKPRPAGARGVADVTIHFTSDRSDDDCNDSINSRDVSPTVPSMDRFITVGGHGEANWFRPRHATRVTL